jgi:hypothetical protein
MNALVRQEQGARPMALGKSQRERVLWLQTRIEDHGPAKAISADVAPDATERRALERRRADLDMGLAGCGADLVKGMVGVLMAGYPVGRAQADARPAMTAFIAALQDQPAWAVKEACGEWNKTGKFAPTPAELRALCLKATRFVTEERTAIRAVLEAEIYTPITAEERARVAERAAEHRRLAAETMGVPSAAPASMLAKAVLAGDIEAARDVQASQPVKASDALLKLLAEKEPGA